MYPSHKKSIILVTLVLLTGGIISSQAPFSRGVNLTSWFQAGSAGKIHFTKFTIKDFSDIKSLGCDVVRLPINLHDMTSGSPSYTIDPLFFSYLDSAVTWCEKLHLYLILDNHSFDPVTETGAEIGTILNKVWPQIALRYKDRSGYILYEILNEPHGISTSVWGSIQGQVIDAIRAVDTMHIIVVGGSDYNRYTELKNLPAYADKKLLYTFHFYDPFMFTHQGATWTSPSMGPLSGVPFPYDAPKMPECPASLRGTWIESGLKKYRTEGNAEKIKSLIDIAVSFRESEKVNIFCGELGAYTIYTDNGERCHWYTIVRDYLEEKNIPWTIWDYKGGFGIFNKGTGEIFPRDLNLDLIDSLKLTRP